MKFENHCSRGECCVKCRICIDVGGRLATTERRKERHRYPRSTSDQGLPIGRHAGERIWDRRPHRRLTKVTLYTQDNVLLSLWSYANYRFSHPNTLRILEIHWNSYWKCIDITKPSDLTIVLNRTAFAVYSKSARF